MREKLTDFSSAELVRANRANLYEFFRSLEDSSFMDFSRQDGLLRWSCPFQYSWVNAVLCSRDATPQDGAFVDESLAYFRSRKTFEISWWLEDGVDLAGWQDLLRPRGLKLEQGPPGMSMDLNMLKEMDNLPGVEIKIVRDRQSMQDCANALIHGNGFPSDWEPIVFNFLAGIGWDGLYQIYVAYRNGRPVSTAGVFLGREVAGIYSVATIPAARGKGIGAAITQKPLLDARKMGYRVGTMQSSEMGFPIYKKMGFKSDFHLGSFYAQL